MKRTFWFLRVVVLIAACLVNASCVSGGKLKHSYNEKLTMRVKVLSAIDENWTMTTNIGIVTSFVWVEIISPEPHKKAKVQLILQRGDASKYPRPSQDEIWREVQSVQSIDVIYNKDTGAYFLYPPLNIPPRDWDF